MWPSTCGGVRPASGAGWATDSRRRTIARCGCPPGFAHGFYTVSEYAEVLYKVTEVYDPENERTLLWNDPQLAIAWPLVEGRPPLLSPKDAAGVPLAKAEAYP